MARRKFLFQLLNKFSLRGWRARKGKGAEGKIERALAAEPLEAGGEAATNIKVPLPILLAVSPLASCDFAAKTYFRARLQYRQLRRLHAG